MPAILPSLPPPAATKRVCASPLSAPTSSQRNSRVKTFDFVGDTVEPLSFGPRVSDMRYLDRPRSKHTLDSALRHLTPHMNGCYRWVRFRGQRPVDLAPTYDVEYTVGALGDVADVRVGKGGKGKAVADLAGCVAEGLRGMRVIGSTTQTTRVKGSISFVKSGLKRPSQRTERPRNLLPPPLPVTACTDVPATGVATKFDGGKLATYDDWDHFHHQWERDQASTLYRKRHPNKRFGKAPRVHGDCAYMSGAIDKTIIRDAVRSNVGSLRSCYRKVLQGDPAVVGTSVAIFSLVSAGVPDELQVKGKHAGLNACVEAAIKELKVPALAEGRTNLRYPFTFQLAKLSKLPADGLPRARALLASGDADQAAKQFAQVIRDSSGGVDECLGRVGMLEAMLVKAPWVIDERVRVAAADVARHASKLDNSESIRACRARAVALTNRVATWPLTLDTRGWRYKPHVDLFPESASIVTRVQALLKEWPTHPNRIELQILLGREQVRSGLPYEARETLYSVMASKLEDRQVRRALNVYSAAAKPSSYGEVYRTNSCGSY